MSIHLDLASPVASLLRGTQLTRFELARRSGRAAGGIKTGPIRGLAALARLARLAGYELVLSLVPIAARDEAITMMAALTAYRRGIADGLAFVLGEERSTVSTVVATLVLQGWTVLLTGAAADEVTVVQSPDGQRTAIGAAPLYPRAVHLD